MPIAASGWRSPAVSLPLPFLGFLERVADDVGQIAAVAAAVAGDTAAEPDPFDRGRPGNAARMTDENDRTDRSGTDEPDGTPAFAASLRSPGDSLTTAPNGGDDLAPDPDEAGSASVGGRAGYDAEAVSGDAEEYRPD